MGEEPLTSENELIARAQGGDAAAFCALAARYERRVYSLALYFCRDRADAEDLSQEVWLRAFRALAQFRGESSFYTWLRRIAVNAFLNSRESAQRRDEARPAGDVEEARAAGAGAAAAGDAAAALDAQLLTGEVWRALGELPRQQRLVFLLKHREGMTYEEIARALDCSTGTAKKALFRAVTKLRARLCAGAGGEAGDAAALSACHAREVF